MMIDCEAGESKIDMDDGSIQFCISPRQEFSSLNDIYGRSPFFSPRMFSPSQRSGCSTLSFHTPLSDEGAQLRRTSGIADMFYSQGRASVREIKLLFSPKNERAWVSPYPETKKKEVSNLYAAHSIADLELTPTQQTEAGNSGAESRDQSLNMLKDKIAETRSAIENGVSPVPSNQEAWSSRQVDMFLKEYRRLYRKKKEELEAVKSSLRRQKEVEMDLRDERHKLLRLASEDHAERNSRLEASIKDMERTVLEQKSIARNLKSENEKALRTNVDLVCRLKKESTDSTRKDSVLKLQIHTLKTEHVHAMTAMEQRLVESNNLVRELQAQSQAWKESNDEIQSLQQRLDLQTERAKRFRKKQLELKQERDLMEERIKSQDELISQLQKYKTKYLRLKQEGTSTKETIKSPDALFSPEQKYKAKYLKLKQESFSMRESIRSQDKQISQLQREASTTTILQEKTASKPSSSTKETIKSPDALFSPEQDYKTKHPKLKQEGNSMKETIKSPDTLFSPEQKYKEKYSKMKQEGTLKDTIKSPEALFSPEQKYKAKHSKLKQEGALTKETIKSPDVLFSPEQKYKAKYLKLKQESSSMRESIKSQDEQISQLQREASSSQILQEKTTRRSSYSGREAKKNKQQILASTSQIKQEKTTRRSSYSGRESKKNNATKF
eukprot:scaffold23474_cov125-Cylindrotheca_fusiformis.AAC.4